VRRAAVGSTEDARRAGTRAAISATTPISSTAAQARSRPRRYLFACGIFCPFAGAQRPDLRRCLSCGSFDLSPIKPRLWYYYFVLWKKGVRASQAKTPRGIRNLARDCDSPQSPPHTFPKVRKSRWLLWLDDPSSDESRRAAAALRHTTAMLTNEIHGASAPLHPFVLFQH
jgi:hypothetical protein